MINLNLTVDEINVALSHLGNGIYKDVAPIITKIHQQAIPQIEAIKKTSEDEKEKVES
jgi:hypothetical protein